MIKEVLMGLDTVVLKEKLNEYAQYISEIRRLSAVSIEDISDANDYSRELQDDYDKIGTIGHKTRNILSEYLFPIIRSSERLSKDVALVLQDFCNLLLNPSNGDELDLLLLFEVSDRLLEELKELGLTNEYAAQLNLHISVCYNIVNRTARLTGNRRINAFYRDEGLKAAEQAKELIQKENFEKLDNTGRTEVIRAVKFYSALYDTFFAEEETNAIRYKILEDALDISEDSYFRTRITDYSWKKHMCKCLEHMGQLTERGNRWNISTKQCQEICKQLDKLKKLWESGDEEVRDCIHEAHYNLIMLRNEYFAGHSDKESYQRALLDLYEKYGDTSYDMYSVQINLLVPTEYIATIDEANISPEEKDTLNTIYNQIVFYVLNSVNMDAFNYLQEYLVGFLEEFIEIPGGMTFETMALQCLAALHPPTYVHSMQVADITTLLAGYIIKETPGEFVGILGCKSVEDVQKNKAELLDHAYHCGLCHDIGKLTEVDTIFTYGRALNSNEFDIIRMHTIMGKTFLEKYKSTGAYACAAESHHKWWDGTGGYPEIDHKVDAISGILRIADCIDAATDSIGRSYNKGKSLEEILEEIISEAPGRFMPAAVRLLSKREIVGDLKYAITNGRMRNYKNTYIILHEAEKRMFNT